MTDQRAQELAFHSTTYLTPSEQQEVCAALVAVVHDLRVANQAMVDMKNQLFATQDALQEACATIGAAAPPAWTHVWPGEL